MPHSASSPIIVEIWSNQLDHSSFKAFLSTLSLCNVHWQILLHHDKANVWCLLNLDQHEDELVELYLDMFDKPKVVYLGSQFMGAPIAEWVFFKAPINVQALNNWLTKNQFIISNEGVGDTGGAERWRSQPFKLQFWPNVSNYTDNPEIVQICSMLMRDWTDYGALGGSSLPKDILQQLLNDAEAEGNLIYQPVAERATHTTPTPTGDKPAKGEQKDTAWGFFKGLFNRFVK